MTRRPGNGVLPLDPAEDALLRAFARVLVTVPRLLDEDLLRDEGMAHSEYLSLAHLSEAPGRRLRMSDLAAAVALSLSGVTRVVQRLEDSGLVVRERSADDRRGRYAVLTDDGFARLEEAWPAHLRSTRRRLFDHLDGVDLPALTAALTRMAPAGAEVCAPPSCPPHP